jgi:hypothetical protein
MTNIQASIPDRVRLNLKKFSNHRDDVTCLECGYRGLMGITRKVVPWYASWFVIIPLCMTGVGIIGAFILGMFRTTRTKVFCFCPNCQQEIGPL